MMKRHNLRKIVTAALLLTIAFAALPELSLAGCGWGHHDPPAATEEDRQNLLAVEKKYAPQLRELEKKLDAKADEMTRARANGSTTLAEMDALRNEMHELKGEYWELSEEAGLEAGRAGGGHHGCGPGGCDHRHHRQDCRCGCSGPDNHRGSGGHAPGRWGRGCRW